MIHKAKYIQNLGSDFKQIIKLKFSTGASIKINPKVCIVGSGPAALYTAQYLLKSINNLTIDVFEKLPVPFGLVRYGVAPDHQDVKNVINSFTETLKNKQVNFFGNVSIGTDVKISELLGAYNSVVLAYGSMGDNYLNISGEKEFSNVISARDIVSLYNGLPNSEKLKIDLSGKQAVIIGAGNVAIDVARMLVSPIEKLAQTDISSFALNLLKTNNNIEHVSIVARRGVLNAAFTLKELRELTKLESVECRLNAENFSELNLENLLSKLARPRRRITEFLYNLSKQTKSSEPKKIIELKFLKTPLEIFGNDKKQVTGVQFKNNKYNFDFDNLNKNFDSDDNLNSIPIIEDSNKKVELMPCNLLVKSIGYKNVSIDSEIPFDKKLGVVLNDKGKVIGKDGLYCTGWIKRGPRGVIVDTTSDAYETAQKMATDLINTSADKAGAEMVKTILKQRNVRFVDKEGWDRIDKAEIKKGKEVGKPREKLQSIDEMLKVALEN